MVKPGLARLPPQNHYLCRSLQLQHNHNNNNNNGNGNKQAQQQQQLVSANYIDDE